MTEAFPGGIVAKCHVDLWLEPRPTDDELEEALAEAARSILRRLDADEAWLPTLDGDADPWSHVEDTTRTLEELAPKKRRQSGGVAACTDSAAEWFQ